LDISTCVRRQRSTETLCYTDTFRYTMWCFRVC